MYENQRSIAITVHRPMMRGAATNVTRTTSFAALSGVADQITEPKTDVSAGRIVGKMGDGSALILGFIAKGIDGATAKARLWLWIKKKRTETDDEKLYPPQWTKVLWLDMQLTASARVGISRTDGVTPAVSATERYVDTIVLATNGDHSFGQTAKISGNQTSPDDTPAMITVDTWIADFYEVEMTNELVSGTATTELMCETCVIGSG